MDKGTKPMVTNALEVSLSWFENGKARNVCFDDYDLFVESDKLDFNQIYDHCKKKALMKRIGNPDNRDINAKLSFYVTVKKDNN